VFSSTCATYGVPESLPIGERTRSGPSILCGESKHFIERALHWYGAAHGLRWVALRYFNAAGADPAGELGESTTRRRTSDPARDLGAALGRRAPLQIYGTTIPTADGHCECATTCM
jgi:UDP-arabinose 4-epimerase